MLDYYFNIELQIFYSIVIVYLILHLIPMRRKFKIAIIIIYMFIMSRTFLILFETLKTYNIMRHRKEQHLSSSYISKIFRYVNIDANFNRLPKRNTILLVNYPAQRIEYMLQTIFPRRLCLVSSVRAKGFVSLIYPEEQLILLSDGNGKFEKTKEMIKNKINDYTIFVYANDNNTRVGEYHVGKLRKGMFYIAKELGIPITPVAISHIEPVCGAILNQTIYIRVGATKQVFDPVQSIIDTRRFLQRNLNRFRDL